MWVEVAKTLCVVKLAWLHAAPLPGAQTAAPLLALSSQVPCKLRLVALAALLRARLAAAPASCKMVVFLSTTDSVEFYHSGALTPLLFMMYA